MKDITQNFGTLYHPKTALIFYQTDERNPNTYVEHFEMDKNGNPINAHPLTEREAKALAKSLNLTTKKEKKQEFDMTKFWKCPKCGKDVILQKKQVGVDENGNPVLNEYAICKDCKKQWNLDKQRAKKSAPKPAASVAKHTEAAPKQEAPKAPVEKTEETKATEQKKIADILSTVDKKIAFVEENINATEELKKGLMQKLLTEGIGHTEFKDSELGRIPQSWEVVKFKEITKVRQGLQIPISKRKKEKCENCYEYITIQFIKNNKEVEYIENPQKTVICTENDILMTRTGNTGIVVTNVKGVFHNNFFLIDFDRNEISKEYLVYYLNSNSIQKEILLRAGATTIPDLNHGDFYSIKFISPPLEEQKQIAEILSTVDNKLENLKEKKQSFEELKKGLMQKLLTGEVRV